MKIHDINILWFALPLNILVILCYVNTHKKPRTTQKIPTTRLLCECELYAAANYDNDPQMKEVMDNFNKQTQQRFHEYDERMQITRQKCKEQCDKEIQKIILKDKLEKELMHKFATLDTDIQSDAIPTCVCEKSIADKVEKGCLRCGGVLGGGVLPGFGTIGGSTLYALYQLKTKAIADAIAVALELNDAVISAAAKAAGDAAGAAKLIELVKSTFHVTTLNGKTLESVFTAKNYNVTPTITQYIFTEFSNTCLKPESEHKLLCFYGSRGASPKVSATSAYRPINAQVTNIVRQGKQSAEAAEIAESANLTAEFTKNQTVLLEAGFNSTTTSIYVSIIAVVVIVLIMVIIYLILRYRRKKKMKKKVQYIKLLEE
ncbi:rifin [Plasmodium reichenowi]|uniref:Rifin n=1 Tax=Plasmodium reichenowi TaxID=5854 RepID=A0A060RMJ0_PLARE|nr:rifin [Plasmodium reichenowi]